MPRLARRIAVLLTLLGGVLVAQAPPVSAAPFDSLPAPQRVLDTRPTGATADGTNAREGGFAPSEVRRIQIAGRVGMAPAARNAVLNVTAVRPGANGYLTLYPCGAVPNASNVNYVAGQNTANSVIVGLDATGGVCVFSSAPSDVLIDTSGNLPADGFSVLPEPRRILDTRSFGTTIDGGDQGVGAIAARTTYPLRVAGRAGVAADASTVVVSVAAADPDGIGFLTVWACGTQPLASNLNYSPGRATANVVTVQLDPDGNICIYSSRRTQVILDVAGSLDAATYTPVTPTRLVDSRPDGRTPDGVGAAIGIRPASGTLRVPTASRAQIPADATAVVLNVTSVASLAPGFVTVYPRGVVRPDASNVNHVPAQNVANLVVARRGTNGDICMFTSATTHLVVDVAGYFTGTPPTGSGAACPADPPGTPPPPNPPTGPGFTPDNYTVGADLPAGRYTMENATGACYWERQSSLGGTFEEIISNEFRNNDGRVIVDILPSDVGFEFSAPCGRMTAYAGSTLRATTIVTGAHVVNEHIVPGTYTTLAGDGCFWQRLSGFDNSLEATIQNEFTGTAGQRTVTIAATDVGFDSGGCGTWTKV